MIRVKEMSKGFKQRSPIKLIVMIYVLAIALSTFLLKAPILLNENASLSLFDSLFTAVSAISVTGLSVIQIDQVFNTTGYFVLSFIFQLGGVGIMTLGTAVYLILRKKIGIRERQLISIDQNQSTLSGLVRLLTKIMQTIIVIELIGMIIFSIYYFNYFDTWQEAVLQSYFASISATTNAGVDITGTSLIPFSDDYFVQIVYVILMIFGAIGFPILVECEEWIRNKRKNIKRFYFSTFAKLTTSTYFLLVIFGAFLIFILERNHLYQDQTWYEGFFSSFFHSTTTRSGGQVNVDVRSFSNPTLMVLSLLMFIGASPSSAGGGVRTTTFAIILLALYNYAKGQQSVKIFKREISQEDVIRSFIVVVTAGLLILTALLILSITEPFSQLELLFEVISAFGTTGLSLGITAELSVIGRIVIMSMMFIGRIGIFSFLFLIHGEPTKDLYRYPKARMIIG